MPPTAQPEAQAPWITTPANSSSAAAFCEGASAPWRGFRYLAANPPLWRYAALPVILNLFITALSLLTLISLVVLFIRYIHPLLTTDVEGVWRWLAWGGELLIAIVMLLVCGGLTILMWKLMEGVLCGYFYGVLVERVERQLGIDEGEITSITFVYNLIDTVINLSLLVSINVLFFMLNFFPVIGGVAALILSTSFTWFVLGVDFLNYPLALRGVRRMDQFRYGQRHICHNMGIGAAVFIFEFLPIIGAVLVTSSAVGAVLLHRKIELAKSLSASSNSP